MSSVWPKVQLLCCYKVLTFSDLYLKTNKQKNKYPVILSLKLSLEMIVVKVQINQEGKIESVLFGYFLSSRAQMKMLLSRRPSGVNFPSWSHFQKHLGRYQIEPFFPQNIQCVCFCLLIYNVCICICVCV